MFFLSNSAVSVQPTKQLLASNVNTFRAINSTAVGGGGRSKPVSKAKPAAVDAMDEAGGADREEGRTTEAEVKELVEGVLKTESLEGRRAASMDIDDLLALLSSFNEKGVHFA